MISAFKRIIRLENRHHNFNLQGLIEKFRDWIH